jgi:hypothetical protein
MLCTGRFLVSGLIYSGICLQAGNQIIAVIFSFAQHGNMPGMQHVKGTERNANLFAFGL